MMPIRVTPLVAMLLAALLAASCGTRKQAATLDPSVAEASGSDLVPTIVQAVNANRHDDMALSARVSLSLQTGDKRTALGGTLRMKHGDVIQLSLTALGLFEVARLELTPDYFLAIDKMGRQYLKASFADVPFLHSAGIDFHTLEALFWDELFLFSGSAKVPREQQFRKTTDEHRARLVNDDSRLAVLSFLVNTLTGLLEQTTVAPHDPLRQPFLRWEYADFAPLGGKQFPTHHVITIPAGGRPICAEMSLSALRADGSWPTRTEMPGRNYREMSPERLLSLIKNLNP